MGLCVLYILTHIRSPVNLLREFSGKKRLLSPTYAGKIPSEKGEDSPLMHFYVENEYICCIKKQRIFVIEMSLQEGSFVIKYKHPWAKNF